LEFICPGGRTGKADKEQEITVFELPFPSDASDIKFRAVQWICTEVMLALAVGVNLLPRKSTHPPNLPYIHSVPSIPGSYTHI